MCPGEACWQHATQAQEQQPTRPGELAKRSLQLLESDPLAARDTALRALSVESWPRPGLSREAGWLAAGLAQKALGDVEGSLESFDHARHCDIEQIRIRAEHEYAKLVQRSETASAMELEPDDSSAPSHEYESRLPEEDRRPQALRCPNGAMRIVLEFVFCGVFILLILY